LVSYGYNNGYGYYNNYGYGTYAEIIIITILTEEARTSEYNYGR
jgi:hypothetical protein